jgi:hypothetical protein
VIGTEILEAEDLAADRGLEQEIVKARFTREALLLKAGELGVELLQPAQLRIERGAAKVGDAPVILMQPQRRAQGRPPGEMAGEVNLGQLMKLRVR